MSIVIEAVRIIGMTEMEWINPVKHVEFNGDSFSIYNGNHSYEYPFEDFPNWVFRQHHIMKG